jgi:hypothetical protein
MTVESAKEKNKKQRKFFSYFFSFLEDPVHVMSNFDMDIISQVILRQK